MFMTTLMVITKMKIKKVNKEMQKNKWLETQMLYSIFQFQRSQTISLVFIKMTFMIKRKFHL
jgi:hypothetical protein